MSDELEKLRGAVRFNASRFRFNAGTAKAKCEESSLIVTKDFHGGARLAFELAASQAESLLTDDHQDYLEAEEEKSKFRELLNVVRAGVVQNTPPFFGASGGNTEQERGARSAFKEIETWIEEVLKDDD